MPHLVRIDPARNMYRWYRVELASSLFEAFVVVRAWGRLGTPAQHIRLTVVADQAEGEKLVEKIKLRRLKRGYILREEPDHAFTPY